MINFTPAQSKIASDGNRFRVINAGRRFGKTVLCVWEMIAMASSKPNSKIAYISPTYQSSRDIAWAQLKEACQDLIVGQPNESRLEITINSKDGGTSTIFLRGWESVETLRGQNFDLIVLDEVAMMRNFWANWQEILRPTLTDTKGEAMFISTPKGFNHFYELYNLENDPQRGKGFKSYTFTSYDNPHLPREELEDAKSELTEDRFAQEYLADFRKTEGLVYKEFSRGLHIFGGDVKSKVVKSLIPVDPGFTNPCGALVIKKDFDDNYWVTREWYETGKTDAEIADYVSALGGNEYYPDPENPGFVEELRRKRVNVREVIKGKGSVQNGISTVRELFKQGRLNIHESCQNLIWEIETYSYPEKKDFQNEPENPIKENDHLVDCLRYALMMDAHKKELQIHAHRYQAPRQRKNIAV